MGIRGLVRQILTERQDKKYRKALAARQVSYPEWVRRRETERRSAEGRIPVRSAEIESAEGRAGAQSAASPTAFCIFHGAGGRLSEHAVEAVERFFRENPEVMIAYGDEDVDGRGLPWFKPDWSPDTFRSFFYFGSVTAVRSELLEEWDTGNGAPEAAAYPCRESFLPYMEELAAAVGGFRKGCRSIGHIPAILFHCDSSGIQEQYLNWKPDAQPWGREVCRKTQADLEAFENGKARGIGAARRNGACQTDGEAAPGAAQGCRAPEEGSAWLRAGELTEGVSVIIPSKDNPETLKRCLASLASAKQGIPYEVIVVDNGSGEENRQKIQKLIHDFINTVPVTYLYHSMEFHFSRMCNMGADTAKGRFLLFLNDDVELAGQGVLEIMASRAAEAYAGAVGIKLYYPGSRRIQHDGITNLPMGPVHKLQFMEDEGSYAFGANTHDRNVLAVTGACLMAEAGKFREAGGFSEELPVAFNDVDLCFTLYELGYHNTVLNSVYGYHHESMSRGADESEEKLDRLVREREKLYARHPGLEGRDPYYAGGWSREGLDTRIRPAYETAGNASQPLAPVPAGRRTDGCREDACLLVRIESCPPCALMGYGVVLGDDNACYDKYLLWKKESADEDGRAKEGPPEADEDREIWLQEAEGQYRPDLVENMSDQRNVGLSGFSFAYREGALPAGTYRLGMMARNRVSGLKLINWSNRRMTAGPD